MRVSVALILLFATLPNLFGKTKPDAGVRGWISAKLDGSISWETFNVGEPAIFAAIDGAPLTLIAKVAPSGSQSFSWIKEGHRYVFILRDLSTGKNGTDIARQDEFLSLDPPPFTVGGDVGNPMLIHKIEPIYTEDAKAAGCEGWVALKAVITKDGETASVQTLGDTIRCRKRKNSVTTRLAAELRSEAIAAVINWRFRPATKAGQPVDVKVQVEVNFRPL
jgi:hypothetical protein